MWTQFVDENGEKLTELFSLRNPRLRPASTKAHSRLVEYEVRWQTAAAPKKTIIMVCVPQSACASASEPQQVHAKQWCKGIWSLVAEGGRQLSTSSSD